MSVITIDRLAGTRAGGVAHLVAERLGYRLLDQDLDGITQARLGGARQAPRWDERLPGHTTWILAFASAMAGEIVSSDLRRTGLATDYFRAMECVVREAATRGRVVFVGRGASAMIGPETEHVSVLLTGAEAARARFFAQDQGIGLPEAHKRIRRLDAEQREYLWQRFSRHLDDPRHYQLVLDSAALGVAPLADIICAAAHELLTGSGVPRPDQAARVAYGPGATEPVLGREGALLPQAHP